MWDFTKEPQIDELKKIDPLSYIEFRKQIEKQATRQTHTTHTTGQAASSLTSTRSDLVTENKMRTLTDEEIRKEYYHLVRSRQQTARVNLLTNKGPLAVVLECHKVPKTCENFLELCESGYYKGTKFHRLIPKFMVSDARA